MSHPGPPSDPAVRLHRSPAMFPADVVAGWVPSLVGDARRWRTNLRYEPSRAVISVHGDEDAAAAEIARLVALARELGTPVIDVYLPETSRSAEVA